MKVLIIVAFIITTCFALKHILSQKIYQLRGNHVYSLKSKLRLSDAYIVLENLNCRITTTISEKAIAKNQRISNNQRVMITGLRSLELTCDNTGPDQEGMLRVYQSVEDHIIRVYYLSDYLVANKLRVNVYNWHYFNVQEYQLQNQFVRIEFNRAVKGGYLSLKGMECNVDFIQKSDDSNVDMLILGRRPRLLNENTIIEEKTEAFLGSIERLHLECWYVEGPGSMSIHIHQDHPRNIKVAYEIPVPSIFQSDQATV